MNSRRQVKCCRLQRTLKYVLCLVPRFVRARVCRISIKEGGIFWKHSTECVCFFVHFVKWRSRSLMLHAVRVTHSEASSVAKQVGDWLLSLISVTSYNVAKLPDILLFDRFQLSGVRLGLKMLLPITERCFSLWRLCIYLAVRILLTNHEVTMECLSWLFP